MHCRMDDTQQRPPNATPRSFTGKTRFSIHSAIATKCFERKLVDTDARAHTALDDVFECAASSMTASAIKRFTDLISLPMFIPINNSIIVWNRVKPMFLLVCCVSAKKKKRETEQNVKTEEEKNAHAQCDFYDCVCVVAIYVRVCSMLAILTA